MRENVSPSARPERRRTGTKQGEDKTVERQRKSGRKETTERAVSQMQMRGDHTDRDRSV